MAMTAEESERFYNLGRDIITELGQAVNRFAEYKRVFDARGGKLGMEGYGTETELFIGVYNNLHTTLVVDNNGWDQGVIDRFRHDY